MIQITARQRRQMKAEAVKEKAWDSSPISAEQIAAQAQAVSNANYLGMGTLHRGRKHSGGSRGGKIAMPVAGSGSGSYGRERLHRVG